MSNHEGGNRKAGEDGKESSRPRKLWLRKREEQHNNLEDENI